MEFETIANGDGTNNCKMDDKTLASFQAWMAGAKKRNIREKLKTVPTLTLNMRRQALVMRRADIAELVPEEDLVAYNEVYKLKTPGGDKQKTPVSDNEIAAYKVLDPDLNGEGVTLDLLNGKIAELIASKVLDKKGNQVGSEENGE